MDETDLTNQHIKEALLTLGAPDYLVTQLTEEDLSTIRQSWFAESLNADLSDLVYTCLAFRMVNQLPLSFRHIIGSRMDDHAYTQLAKLAAVRNIECVRYIDLKRFAADSYLKFVQAVLDVSYINARYLDFSPLSDADYIDHMRMLIDIDPHAFQRLSKERIGEKVYGEIALDIVKRYPAQYAFISSQIDLDYFAIAQEWVKAYPDAIKIISFEQLTVDQCHDLAALAFTFNRSAYKYIDSIKTTDEKLFAIIKAAIEINHHYRKIAPVYKFTSAQRVELNRIPANPDVIPLTVEEVTDVHTSLF